MFGFIFGTACLFGLIKAVRGGHGCGYGRWGGGGCGGGRWGHPGHGRWGGGGRWMLRGLFHRLDTTPGQEKVILSALEELRNGWSKVREEKEKSRADVARAMRGEHFDHDAVKEMFGRHDSSLEELRKTATAALAKVHEALDERQRREVADLLEHGGWGRGRGGWGRWGGGGDGYEGQYV